MDSLRFTINGRQHAVPAGDPALERGLLEYLRTNGLTGCKQACGEGGCGACTVILGRFDATTGKVRHDSVATCLVPLPFVYRTQITTIEGVMALAEQGPHPIAEAFHQLGASQCGFCTPGFLMTLVARLCRGPLPDKEELEHLFDGNLCRCTGYRPILDAAAVFCREPLEDAALTDRIANWRSRFAACRSLVESFPREYCQAGEDRVLTGSRSTFFLPTSLNSLLALTQSSRDVKIVAGNTDLALAESREREAARSRVFLHQVSELHRIEWSAHGVRIGAGVSIRQLAEELPRGIERHRPDGDSGLEALTSQCRFLGNTQIRALATIGGGIVNFSHYSDLIPLWVACEATFVFRHGSEETRLHTVDCYDERGRLTFEPGSHGVLTAVEVPLCGDGETVVNFKYARRRMDSITFMSAGVRSRIGANGTIEDFLLCYDGLGSPAQRAVATESLLKGRDLNRATLTEALSCLARELSERMDNNLPPRLQSYQLRLAQAALVRTFARLREDVFHDLDDRDEGLLSRYPAVSHRSNVTYEEHADGVLGRAIPHRQAALQVTGDAKYTNDLLAAGCLYAAVVTSPVANGRLLGLDPGDALAHSDAVAFVSAADVPGKNRFGFRVEDEEVLASERVHFVGQIVGVLVAKSPQLARELAAAVRVNVAAEEPVLTIDAAIAADAVHGRRDGYRVRQGDIHKGFADSAVVVEGEVALAGQNHFYLELQNALAIPKDDGFTVYSSTQSPTDVVRHIAALLDIPANTVEVQVGRIGGGFGGKQLRAGPIAALCALAAHKVGQPVKLSLDRPEDMAYCPGRSFGRARYRAGFSDDGQIRALEVDLRLAGGFSSDYSADITEAATLLMDSGYCLANVDLLGTCHRTNTGSTTSTRGFGKPQASAVIETVMDHGASALELDATEVRGRNTYRRGDRTITRTKIGDDVLQRCWQRVLDKGQHERQRREVAAFNQDHRWRKRGVAVTVSKGNMGFLESADINRGLALVHVLQDGTVSVNHSGVEMGQGINTRMAQVTAAALGVPLEDVVVTDTRSALIPNTPPTTMVATDLIGEAILNACTTLSATFEKYAGTFRERVARAYEQGDNLSAPGIHTAPRLAYDYEKQEGDISYFFVWGAAQSVVELDVLSGSFRIVSSTVVQDCGKSLNPHLDVGQAEGGFLYGVGYYMMEEMIYDPSGRLITDNVSGYKVPSAGDVPQEWNIELLQERPGMSGLHNSKGIGESNVQLGLSVYFACKEAVRATRREAGLDPVFSLGFPASVERVAACLPTIDELLSRQS